MTESPELVEKRRRIHALLDAHDLDALVLRAPGNVAWYAGGARTHLMPTAEIGLADLVITRQGEQLVGPITEVQRLLDEELGPLDPEVLTVGWGEDPTTLLPDGPRVGVDVPLGDRTEMSAAIEAARRSLLPAEVDRYRGLGAATASALTAVLGAAGPRRTEREVAADVGRTLAAQGIDPILVQVAGERRAPLYRHFLPTGDALGRRVVVAVCARRHGLVASLTRVASFGPLTSADSDVEARLLHVEAAFLARTSVDAAVGDIFRAGAAAYATNGFDHQEHLRHHQGGPTGYAARDYVATEQSTPVVVAAQAFAWNPTVTGMKVEDTVVTSPHGLEILTVDPGWPTAELDGLRRPLTLVL